MFINCWINCYTLLSLKTPDIPVLLCWLAWRSNDCCSGMTVRIIWTVAFRKHVLPRFLSPLGARTWSHRKIRLSQIQNSYECAGKAWHGTYTTCNTVQLRQHWQSTVNNWRWTWKCNWRTATQCNCFHSYNIKQLHTCDYTLDTNICKCAGQVLTERKETVRLQHAVTMSKKWTVHLSALYFRHHVIGHSWQHASLTITG